ncbi:MAG: hypothetical protein JO360_13190 [Acidobacteria bacterium]|nr:hypothetical protein [Acidobacteriota bacterium]
MSRDRFEDYVPVAERIEQFYNAYPAGRILTSIIEHDREAGFVLIRAEVYRTSEDTMPSATGHAFEVRGESYVNKTSYLENCETSSVGRALALLGFEVKRGIASREEMEKAARGGGGAKAKAATAQSPAPASQTPQAAPDTRHATLDAQIRQAWKDAGYEPEKLTQTLNKRFKIEDGLNGLSTEMKEQVLSGLRKGAA